METKLLEIQNALVSALMLIKEITKGEDLNMFLKEKGALEKYNRNIPEYMRKSIDRTELSQKILVAFNWSETPEGLDYWMDLNKEWQKRLGACND